MPDETPSLVVPFPPTMTRESALAAILGDLPATAKHPITGQLMLTTQGQFAYQLVDSLAALGLLAFTNPAVEANTSPANPLPPVEPE